MKFRYILSVIAYIIMAQVVHTVGSILSMKYYIMPEYFSVWSKLMMPNAGPPPTSFYFISFFCSLVMGIMLLAVYLFIRDSFRTKSRAKKGLIFALIVMGVSAIPNFLGNVLLINLPAGLLIEWLAEGIIIAICTGLIFSLIAEKK